MLKFYYLSVVILLSLSAMLSGCVSTADPENSTVNTESSVQTTISQAEIDNNNHSVIRPIEKSTEDSQKSNENEIDKINEQLTIRASTTPVFEEAETVDRFSYALGAGDVIEIAVFQVDELNRKTRVAGDGYIMIPLIGEVYAQGLTTSELETEITTKLAESYLHDPQVSVFIEEFRSHQISVSGAVKQPDIYEIQSAKNILEMLALAGGLSDTAGPQVYVTRIITDKETGKKTRESTVIKFDTLLTSDDTRLNILLKAGDSVHVPKAGVVFVEGAVNSPGAYQIKGEMNLLKAIAVAGDIKFEAKRGNVQIFRELNGQTNLIEIDLDAIKSRTVEDVTLIDGDIIVVPDNKLKKGWSGFWKGISGIFSVGTRI